MTDTVNIQYCMDKFNGEDSKISVVIDAVSNTALKYILECLIDTTSSVYCLGCGEADFSLAGVKVFYNDLCANKLEYTKDRVQLSDDIYFLNYDVLKVKPKDDSVAVCNFSLHEFSVDEYGKFDEIYLEDYVKYLAKNYERILIGEAGLGFLELFSDNHPYIEPKKLIEMFEDYGFDIEYKPIKLSENNDIIIESTPKIRSLTGFVENYYGQNITTEYLRHKLNVIKNDTIAYVLDIQKT
ncbi:hypothetical protein GQ473_07215 [archaeon]|nr:hypothetical protein [archaeon]